MICLHTDRNCPYVDRENISMTKKCIECENYGENQKRSLYRSRIRKLYFYIILVLITGLWFLISATKDGSQTLIALFSFGIFAGLTIRQLQKLYREDRHVK